LPGVDFEFQGFPATITVSEHGTVRRTRVGLATGISPEFRLGLVLGLEKQEQIAFCKRLLLLDPADSVMLYWLFGQLPPHEIIGFLESRLDARPIPVEWHRLYQSEMERQHPEVDLGPRYRKLLEDTGGQADALYLLGRTEPDLEVGDKL